MRLQEEKIQDLKSNRLKLSYKELYAVADYSDKETEEHDLEKLGKDNGGISALIDLKVTSAMKR